MRTIRAFLILLTFVAPALSQERQPSPPFVLTPFENFSFGSGLTLAMRTNVMVQNVISNALFSTNFIYCNGNTGNDGTAVPGNATKPAKNIQTAFALIQGVTTNGVIVVAPGNYSLEAVPPAGLTVSNFSSVTLIDPGVTYTQSGGTNDMVTLGNTSSLYEFGNSTWWRNPNGTNVSIISAIASLNHSLAFYASGVSYYCPNDFFDPNTASMVPNAYQSGLSALFHLDNGTFYGSWDAYPPGVATAVNVTNSSMELVNFNIVITNRANASVNNGGLHALRMLNGNWHVVNSYITNYYIAADANQSVAFGIQEAGVAPSSYAISNTFVICTNGATAFATNLSNLSGTLWHNPSGFFIVTSDGTNSTWGLKQY
jgi:hypothetical protein